MEIQIPRSKNLFLTSDSDNWIVCKKYQDKKTGKDKCFNHRYYSTITSAIEYIFDHVLKDCADLKEIRQKQIEMAEWVEKELKPTVK
ncbi:hypothetical protein KJ966_10175 [bacterium]|nr:hypothetical protein [bacterium]